MITRIPKAIKVVLIAVCGVVGLLLLLDPFIGGAAKRAHALFDENVPAEQLPKEVTITIDGAKATFQKGSQSYGQFSRILRRPIDTSLGPVPSFTTRAPCGELAVTYFAITIHFTLYRSTVNRNFLWIRLPKITSPGMTYPTIIDDGALFRFVQNAGQGHYPQGPQ